MAASFALIVAVVAAVTSPITAANPAKAHSVGPVIASFPNIAAKLESPALSAIKPVKALAKAVAPAVTPGNASVMPVSPDNRPENISVPACTIGVIASPKDWASNWD